MVSVISESRTTASRTYTARPDTPVARSSAATSPRNRSHQASSASSDRSVIMTFSTR